MQYFISGKNKTLCQGLQEGEHHTWARGQKGELGVSQKFLGISSEHRNERKTQSRLCSIARGCHRTRLCMQGLCHVSSLAPHSGAMHKIEASSKRRGRGKLHGTLRCQAKPHLSFTTGQADHEARSTG